MIRFLIPFLFSVSCMAQLPVVPFVTQPVKSTVPTANLIIWADSVAGSKWYNSSGSSSPANNDKIAGYTDISGNNNHLTNTGSSTVMGTYKTAGGPPNGNPYVVFSSGALGTGLSNYLNAVTLSQPNTFYFVWIVNFGAVNQTAFDSPVSSATARNVYYATTGGGGQRLMYAGANSVDVTSLNMTAWTVITFQYNGSSSLWRTNGVVGQSGLNPSTQGIEGFLVGNTQLGNQPADMSLAAVLVYNAGHNSATMHQIETFLGNEYGVTIH